ncbi:hypothetical protein CPHO_03140 [Corynebacterium phocae]|uniref:Or membrane protein n=1 Tax=Corynebacterium phocae TaxID=161895 RepID=A0A1L7D1Z8_9CORY|nr:hypothetical protein [Corynebacterium phocae]APT92052.1 hypothetical protein CPHO_03140 [Corynebacterium phocae]KAA8726435.1 hypothetical protein F4V58_02685 [Corynebacterium phocae]
MFNHIRTLAAAAVLSAGLISAPTAAALPVPVGPGQISHSQISHNRAVAQPTLRALGFLRLPQPKAPNDSDSSSGREDSSRGKEKELTVGFAVVATVVSLVALVATILPYYAHALPSELRALLGLGPR